MNQPCRRQTAAGRVSGNLMTKVTVYFRTIRSGFNTPAKQRNSKSKQDRPACEQHNLEQRDPNYHNQLVSRLYDIERPVQKYPQWKCSFTDQRIFVLLTNLAQHVLIHMKAKKKRCLPLSGRYRFFIHIFLLLLLR